VIGGRQPVATTAPCYSPTRPQAPAGAVLPSNSGSGMSGANVLPPLPSVTAVKATIRLLVINSNTRTARWKQRDFAHDGFPSTPSGRFRHPMKQEPQSRLDFSVVCGSLGPDAGQPWQSAVTVGGGGRMTRFPCAAVGAQGRASEWGAESRCGVSTHEAGPMAGRTDPGPGSRRRR